MKNMDELQKLRESEEIDLFYYWAVVLKRKWLIFAVTMTVFLLSALVAVTRTPHYVARGQILINKEMNLFSLDTLVDFSGLEEDYLQTQYKLLKSRSLAENIIDRLKLVESAEFVGKPGKPVDLKSVEYSTLRENIADRLIAGLVVSPVRLTRLVDVTFEATSRQLAADIVNGFLDSFIESRIEDNSSTTVQATEFLTEQIASLKSDIEGKERQLQVYGVKKNIVILSDKENTIVAKLSDINNALINAQLERVNKESYYNEIRNTTPDLASQASANPVIQRLREEYIKLSREYAKKLETFRPDYPEMQKLKVDIESAKRILESETQSLVQSAYADYQAVLNKEQSLQKLFDTQKQETIQLNNNLISYGTLKNEIDNNKVLLDNLIRRQSEMGVTVRLRGSKNSNIKIVDRAVVPRNPSGPGKKKIMLIGFFLGLMGGVGLAFLLVYLDNSVKEPDDVEKYLKAPTLGIIPAFNAKNFKKGHDYGYGYGIGRKRNKRTNTGSEAEPTAEAPDSDKNIRPIQSIDLITMTSPRSSFSESYRSIRTALMLSSTDLNSKALVMTSALPEEGKSTTIANLAVTLAQTGKNVLLVDGDFRKPRLHKIFQIKNMNGLTNYLTGKTEIKDLIKTTPVPNLYLINSGPVPPNPAELLGSKKMGDFLIKLKQTFDLVLIDTPPMLSVTDALVLGPEINGVLLVV